MLDAGAEKCDAPHEGKYRTISCSTEESGVESLSPADHSSNHQSEAESETSDYPRSTPSPSTAKSSSSSSLTGLLVDLSKQNTSKPCRTKSVDWPAARPPAPSDSRPTRRTTLPSLSTVTSLHNLKVSLLKLPAATLKAHLPENNEFADTKSKNEPLLPVDVKRSAAADLCSQTKCKKAKLESAAADPASTSTPAVGEPSSQRTAPCNHLLVPGDADAKPVFTNGLCLKNEAAADLKGPAQGSLEAKAEDMKLEIAKIDSILQGNLLLDKSSHKISEILLYDNLRSSMCIKNEAEAVGVKSEVKPSLGNILPKTDLQQEEEEEVERVADQPERVVEEASVPDREFVKCHWRGCGLDVEDMHLLEHLNGEHLKEAEKEECLWVGCKVYGATSSAKDWLKKHITTHIGSKPFRCILDSCRMKFSSQISLSRHVNSHFKPPANPAGQSNRRTPDSTPIKFYIRKTRRKNRTRHHAPPLINNIDLFDVGTMAGIKDGLSKVKRKTRHCRQSDLIRFDGAGTSVVLTSKVKGRKLDGEGNIRFLVEWHPLGMLEPEWVPQESFKSRRKVLINQLDPAARDIVEDHIFGRQDRRKSARKTRPYRGPPRLT